VKKILLANDDGYLSAGFFPLLDELKRNYDVTAVAPKEEKSWVGKSMSAHREVAFEKLLHGGHEVFAIDGTPADCVQIGLYDLVPGRPDFVVSGINIGENIGNGRILSSGTIGAAMEGALDGVVSVAASLCDTRDRNIDYFNPDNYHYFINAAKIVSKVIKQLEDITLPLGVDVISVNIPFDASSDAEMVITVPYIDPYGKLFVQNDGVFNHIGAPVKYENLKDGTDIKAIFEGKVAITPIDLRLSNTAAVDFMRKTFLSN
jgi:5'-nucleotidase